MTFLALAILGNWLRILTFSPRFCIMFRILFRLSGIAFLLCSSALFAAPDSNAASNSSAARPSASDSTAAIQSLLREAKQNFDSNQNEQAVALLERALRIDPRNSVLWHNLAGIRLQQQDWARAANLANKSNSLAVDNKWLRVRNWVVIALACEGMADMECAKEARKRAKALAATVPVN